MFERLAVAQKIFAVLAAIMFMVVAGSCLIAITVYSLSRSGTRTGEIHYPLSRAASEIKFRVTEAHLKMEEIMGGDDAETVDSVYEFIDLAKDYAGSILTGGEVAGTTIAAADSEDVRAAIPRLLKELDGFREAVDSRYALLDDEQGVGSGADEEFDALFESLTASLADLAAQFPANAEFQAAIGEARFLITVGHLLVEEVLGGDATEDFAEATSAFENAISSLSVVEAESPEKLIEISNGINRFAELALDRFETERARALEMENAEIAFDAAFTTLLDHAEEADGLIREDIAAAVASMQRSKLVAFTVSGAICLMLAVAVFVSYRTLNRVIAARLTELAGVMHRLLDGDLEIETPAWPATDEVGVLRDSVSQLRAALLRQRELETASELEREKSEEQRQAAEEQKRLAEEACAAADLEREAAAKRAQTAETFAADFSRVVRRAVDGQFDGRIEQAFGEPEYDELRNGLNSVLSAVETSLADTAHALSGVAKGDLSRRMSGEYKGMFAGLQKDVNEAMAQLQALVSRIFETAEAVEAESSSIAENAMTLSGRSEKQAATIEETSAAMTEMAANVKSNASNARSAMNTASEAAERARRGGEIVMTAVQAMERIEASSAEISKIVEVIDSIAFQTNLLALNAGVEAARAGEAGKGFAVVASEVRGLALRASDAARDINALIEKSNSEVHEGSRLVRDSGDALTQIVDNVGKVASSIDEISTASSEQATGIAEVTEAVSLIDSTTQQTAALAGESSTAAKNLASRAGQLRSLVSQFERSSKQGDPEQSSDVDHDTEFWKAAV